MNPPSYAAAFAELIDREDADLTQDERDSLTYYYAEVNLAEGLPVDSEPRQWCDTAADFGRLVVMLGRVPKLGDPGATPRILRWMHEQRAAALNSYQRARLRAILANIQPRPATGSEGGR